MTLWFHPRILSQDSNPGFHPLGKGECLCSAQSPAGVNPRQMPSRFFPPELYKTKPFDGSIVLPWVHLINKPRGVQQTSSAAGISNRGISYVNHLGLQNAKCKIQNTHRDSNPSPRENFSFLLKSTKVFPLIVDFPPNLTFHIPSQLH